MSVRPTTSPRRSTRLREGATGITTDSAAFGAHVTDNTFWIFEQMLGFTTTGTFKIYTLAQSAFAVIGPGVCLLLDLIL